MFVTAKTFVLQGNQLIFQGWSVSHSFLSFFETVLSLITFSGLKEDIFVMLSMLLIVLMLAVFFEFLLTRMCILSEGGNV